MRHAYEPDTVPEIWTVHKATNATTSLHAERGGPNNDTRLFAQYILPGLPEALQYFLITLLLHARAVA